tara:strand:+ start:1316 stop:2815 length:1500 start_codon:yes stop_codon:yes gene_type:complete
MNTSPGTPANSVFFQAATDEQPVEQRIPLDRVEFRTVIEDAPVMLWLTDATGKIVFTNTRWKNFVGSDSFAVHGDNVWIEALHPDDRSRVFADFETAFRAHRPFQMEYRLKRWDSEWRHVMDTGEPYLSPEGAFAGFIGSSTDITEHKRFEEELKRSHADLTRHNRDMGWINQLNSYLQACRTLQETYPVIRHFAGQIFPTSPGTLYLFNETKSLLENVVTWGAPERADALVLSPDDCWALRQGKLHEVDASNRALSCQHAGEGAVRNYVCVPVAAQGEIVGLLHLHVEGADGPQTFDDHPIEHASLLRLVSVTADSLGLSIVSLKLREALESQSVRDPLTGLYNRRHMEESLDREFARVHRTHSSLGVIMLDLDHFKRLNDEYGHDAGDFVLRETAQRLRDALRGSDIACRYGGEEFVLILPDASPAEVLKKAESIRLAIGDQSFLYQSKPLPDISASLGIASLCDGYEDTDEMLRAADGALYAAKRSGRNKVAVADV